MTSISQLEAEHIARSAASRAAAVDVLSRREPATNPFVVIVLVACAAGTFALGGARTGTVFHALIGAAAGGAFMMACLVHRELRVLRRHVEALRTVARDGGSSALS